MLKTVKDSVIEVNANNKFYAQGALASSRRASGGIHPVPRKLNLLIFRHPDSRRQVTVHKRALSNCRLFPSPIDDERLS